jgi:hypothetical protein
MGQVVGRPKASDASPADCGGIGQSAVCVAAAFTAYFCMYGFRKPFTAAGYEGAALGGIGYKAILVTAQVLGYTTSKFIGIKVVAEMRPNRRAAAILGLIGMAEIALVLFALVRPPFNFPLLFLNGLPLGMVFGLVLGFLEGRQHTEALTAGLCASFILADGVTKSVGTYLLQSVHCPTYWMPAAAGLVFAPALLVAVWVLSRTPAPSAVDVAARGERAPMGQHERRAFFGRYAVGLSMIVLTFTLVTVLRSIRADFAPEIWAGLGTKVDAKVYTQSEVWVGLAVTGLCGLAVVVKDNRRAFGLAMTVSLVGLGLIVAALLALSAGAIAAFPFMVLIGVGVYLPYVAVHTTIFERLIAMTRDRGTICYLMSVADAVGYLGYVGVMIARNLVSPGQSFLGFFVFVSWAVAGAGTVMTVLGWWYFATHPATRRPEAA